jgi:hypothetical protein
MAKKVVKIPEQHLNEVKAKYNTLEDLDKQMSKLKRTKEIAHLQMWDFLKNIIPEAEGESCTIDTTKWEIEFGDDGGEGESITEILKKRFGI